MRFFKSKAQSITEYTICVTMVLAALLGMQLYVKRGLQGRYADAVDDTIVAINTTVTKQIDSDGGLTPEAKANLKKHLQASSQYEPPYRKDDIDNTTDIDITEMMLIKGRIDRDIVKDKVTRSGTLTETIDCYEDK
jgi:hypothetical protein